MQFLIVVLTVVVVILALVVAALSKSITDLRERANSHGDMNSALYRELGELKRYVGALEQQMKPKPKPELGEACSPSPSPDANTMRHIHNARDTAIDHCNRATTYRVPGESALGVSVPLRDVVERILEHLSLRPAVVREHIKLEPSCNADCQIEVRDGLLYASDNGIKRA